jgi:hypothetical protein
VCDDLEIGEERYLGDGYYVERRSFVKLVSAVLTAGFAEGPAALMAKDIARSTLSFEEFLAVANPLAKSLLADTSLSGQDRYLLSLADMARRIGYVPIPEMKDSGQGESTGTFIGFNSGGEPFNVLHWRLDPGSRVRPHAHTYGNVVTLGLAGQAVVENFELLGERDFATSEPFKVVRTQKQLLRKGAVNLVNLERNYIHGIAAGPRGARGLDITTRLKARAPTPYLIIPTDAERSVPFQGRWSIDDPLPRR